MGEEYSTNKREEECIQDFVEKLKEEEKRLRRR
jgi:hypothetical protein